MDRSLVLIIGLVVLAVVVLAFLGGQSFNAFAQSKEQIQSEKQKGFISGILDKLL
jgi:hypothetical protein